MSSIGLIGVGLLGSAIATRLKAAGHTVLGYDLLPDRRLGATSAQQVADECRTIVLCLPTSDVVRRLLLAMRDRMVTSPHRPEILTASPAQLSDRVSTAGPE